MIIFYYQKFYNILAKTESYEFITLFRSRP